MNKKKCVGKDSFQRMNYLLQAANELSKQHNNGQIVSQMYSNLLVQISKKTVQRMDVEIKRMICKGCRSILKAGINCTVRIRKKQVKWRCDKCRVVKVFDSKDREYLCWSEKNESLVETIDYTPNTNQDTMETTSNG